MAVVIFYLEVIEIAEYTCPFVILKHKYIKTDIYPYKKYLGDINMWILHDLLAKYISNLDFRSKFNGYICILYIIHNIYNR